MKFFSRITFICNASFVVFIILGYVEYSKRKNKLDDNLIPLPFVTGTLVVLGQFAVFINFIFCLVLLLLLLSKKKVEVPRWLLMVNVFFLLFQVYYFFI